MSRLIDADAVVKYLREFRCADCDKRKGLKNGKVRFCYEIGDAPCRACDIGDTIDYFLDEDIAPTIDTIPVAWLCDYSGNHYDAIGREVTVLEALRQWKKENGDG